MSDAAVTHYTSSASCKPKMGADHSASGCTSVDGDYCQLFTKACLQNSTPPFAVLLTLITCALFLLLFKKRRRRRKAKLA